MAGPYERYRMRQSRRHQIDEANERFFAEEAQLQEERRQRNAEAAFQAAQNVPQWVTDEIHQQAATERHIEEDRPRMTQEANTRGLWTSIVHESFKSLGLRHDPETNEFDWSLENIGVSAKESPGWFAFDVATWAAAPVKAAAAALKVAKGSGLGAQALRVARGANGAKQAEKAVDILRTQQGRLFGRTQFGQAMRLEKRYGTGSGPLSRMMNKWVHNPATDSAQVKMRERFVNDLNWLDPENARNIANAYINEAIAKQAQGAMEQRGVGRSLKRAYKGMKEDMEKAFKQRFDDLMRSGMESGSESFRLAMHGLREQFGDDAVRAFEGTWELRFRTHNMMHEVHLLNDTDWMAGNNVYWPDLVEETLSAPGHRTRAERARFAGTFEPSKITDRMKESTRQAKHARILDPAAQLDEVMAEYQQLARHQMAHMMGRSAIGRNRDELSQAVVEWARNPARSRVSGANARVLARYQGDDAAELLAKATPEEFDHIAKELGWVKYDEVFGTAATGTKRMDEYHEFMNKTGLKGKYLPVEAREEVREMFKMLDPSENTFDTLSRGFYKAMRAFRATKTAYNLATWWRNHFGNVMFFNFAVGRVNLGAPLVGAKHVGENLFQGKVSPLLRRAARAGMFDSSDWAGFSELAARRIGPELGEEMATTSAASILPGFKSLDKMTRGHLDKLARMGEAGYRAVDDMWKVEAFARLEKRALKSMGTTVEKATAAQFDEAAAYAAERITKFMPMFNRQSRFTKAVGQAIPFSSFTTEAFRVWKNAALEKPHLALAWAHSTKLLSYGIGLHAGKSPDQVEAMLDDMGAFNKGKPMLMIPWSDEDGTHDFLDLSPIIPLAGSLAKFQQDLKGESPEGLGLLAPITAFLDPMGANPLLGGVLAATTGIDPFTRRPVEARALKFIPGAWDPESAVGKAVGLGEYMMNQMLPPMLPPGYAYQNFAEYVLGERDSEGEYKEEDLAKVVSANLFGMRFYEPSVRGDRYEDKELTRIHRDKLARYRSHYKKAVANGDVELQGRLLGRIHEVQTTLGHANPDVYIDRLMATTQPGGFGQMPEAEMLRAFQNARERYRGGKMSDQDRRHLNAMALQILMKRGTR